MEIRNMETRENEDQRGHEPVQNNENARIAGMKASRGRGIIFLEG
ncbi:hypothetical protein [Microvirga vignae]|nr:hypothetical protein [Microvirga vignae]